MIKSERMPVNMEKFELYRELQRQKQPLFGSFNILYKEQFRPSNRLINRRFRENFEQDSFEKILNRMDVSRIIRRNLN